MQDTTKISRGQFIEKAGAYAAAVAASGSILSAASCSGSAAHKVKFADLTQALTYLEKLPPATKTSGAWDAAQVLIHCAQSIDFSIRGFPENKPWVVRHTVGPVVFGRFRSHGEMNHDLSAAIPGAPPLPPGLSFQEGMEILRASVTRFLAYNGPLAEHFVYGTMTKTDFDLAHAMHIANHIDEFAI
ncbi:MAG: DUF1569 domain-containing protein [Spirochaetia bacterium]|nr:DUF1569 domain-containing protein [Spirochaetia bacterium]